MIYMIFLVVKKGRPNSTAMNPVCVSVEDNIIDNLKVKTNLYQSITTGAVKPLEHKFRIENDLDQVENDPGEKK